jgi:two-component system, chemotaxis family, response regulator Rcp1
MNDRPHILMVEDNPADVDLLGIALEDHGVDARITPLHDGRQARSRLMDMAQRGECVDLIILDLNIPIVGGLELLALIKQQSQLCGTPTIVMTSSDRRHDRDQAALLGADVYLLKPRDLDGYRRIAQTVAQALPRTGR